MMKTKVKKPYRVKAKKLAQDNNFQDAAEVEEAGKTKFKCGKVKPTNDPQWYFKDAQILKDVASFSFNSPLGSRLPVGSVWAGSASLTNQVSVGTVSVPGLMAITMSPTIGVSTDAQSPANLAATNVYAYIRYKNSGATNYDSPDLMLYLIAMDSIYSCWNWMKRIYGMASTYSQLNKYEPRAYMMANNVDFDDIMAHLADFRGYLNIKASEISAFCVPATMTYNVRHSWLFSNIYKDSDTRKAQQYMFVPGWFYQYDETSSSQGGILNPIPVLVNYVPNSSGNTPFTFESLRNLLNGMLEAVNYSEDIGIMSGDILKAYGEGNLFTLSSIDPDYKVEAVYSREVLTQIENSTSFNITTAALDTFRISQNPNTNFLTCKPYLAELYNGNYKGWMLNFHWENPTPEEVVVATRLTTLCQKAQNPPSGMAFEIISMGSEVCSQSWMYAYSTSASIQDVDSGAALTTLIAMQIESHGIDMRVTSPYNQVVEEVSRIMMITSFDWAPRFHQTIINATTDRLLGATVDYDNYTLLSADNLEAINTMALLTEFNVPND